MIVILPFLIGVVAGLRTMTALAAVGWAAFLGRLPLADGWLAFLGYRWTPWVLSALALGEFVTDQLPGTPSRKVPLQFAARIVVGAVCGAALGASGGSTTVGAVAGIAGALAGTFGGSAARGRLARAFGRDRPAGVTEDAVAAAGALLVVSMLP